MTKHRPGRTSCLAICGAFALSACAFSYEDSSGNRRVIGLVDMTLPSEDEAAGAKKVTIQNVGVMVFSSEASSGASIGYSREELIVLRNDSAVLIPAR